MYFYIFLFFVFSTTSLNAYSEDKYPFYTIFTSKQERIYLDSVRGKTSKEINANKTDKKIVDQYDDLHLSGIITKSNGYQQIWINGKKLINNNEIEATIKSSKEAELSLKNKKGNLKVGEKWRLIK